MNIHTFLIYFNIIYQRSVLTCYQGTMTVSSSQICKYFNTGDFVKVTDGRHTGVSGIVVKYDRTDRTVTIFCHSTCKVYYHLVWYCVYCIITQIITTLKSVMCNSKDSY